MKFNGYLRPDGQVGIRNYLLILPTSVCASHTAANISKMIPGSVALPNQHGCCQVGADHTQTRKTLIHLAKNPNVAAVLVIGLGCDGVQAADIESEIAATGKPVQYLTTQECGGTPQTIAQGIVISQHLKQEISKYHRITCDISQLTLAIECGGSDPTSGIASNPAVGAASDLLLSAGGTVILSETTEFIGAEHLLATRAINDNVANQVLHIVQRVEKRAIELGVDMRGGQPTPGNIAGGLTTIEEKSLGCIYKAGSAPVQGVLDYGDLPKTQGLFIMDTPGQDIESITGMIAGGAQIVVFTTGRGTPTGSPLAPVIKVTGNSQTFELMPDNIDINAGRIITEGASISSLGAEIMEMIIEVANGQTTKAEVLGHQEFGIYKLAPTF